MRDSIAPSIAARTAAACCAAILSGLIVVTAACTREAAPPATPTCDIGHGACEFALPGVAQPARIDFSPRPIPTMRPITVTVRWPGNSPATAALDFQGADMDMGFNRITLRPDKDGQLRGEAMLPVCVGGAMRWHAELQVDGRPLARFAFDTGTVR